MSMTENKKPLAKVQCQHPALFKTMCVSCGKIIKPETGTLGQKTTSLLTLHGGTALQVSNQEAESIQAKKISSLREQKKIALVLDLDHTLLHAIQIDGATPVLNEKGQKVGEKEDIYHLPIEEVVNGFTKHLILKKRPHLDFFLKECHEFCQMTIYTAGTRRYAEAVAKIIDPTRKYFSNRIVSRTDNPNVKNDGHDKSLERIFLSDSSMVVIIDDREDVWKNSNANSADANQLLLARPFIHFNAYNMKNVTGGGGGVIVEANHASGPTGATGQSTAVTATTAAVAPITPVIALAGQYPGKIIKSVSQGSNEYSDADDQLIRCLEITKEIHRRYYDGIINSAGTNSDANTGASGGGSNHFLKNITDKITSRNTATSTSTSTTDNNNSSSKPPVHPGRSLTTSTAVGGGVINRVNNVATILSEMKMTVLAGCTVTFSGIIPTNETAPQNHLLYKLAVSLGATVSLELLPRTTHLISVNINTEKANEAIQKRSHNIWILHPDWLIYCRWALARVYEVTFMLNSMTPGTPFPVPEMNYQPLTPTVSKRPSRKTADSTAGGTGRKVFALDGASTVVNTTTAAPVRTAEGVGKPPLHQQSQQQQHQAEKRGRDEDDDSLSSAVPSSLSLTVPPQDPRRQKRLRITAPGDNVNTQNYGDSGSATGGGEDRSSPLVVDLSCLEAGEILENEPSAAPRTSDKLVSCDSVTSLMEFPTPRPSQAMLYFEPSTPQGGLGTGSSDLDEILGDSEDEGDDNGYKKNNSNKKRSKQDSTTSLATADTFDSTATGDSSTDSSNTNSSNNNGYSNEYIIDNEDEDVYGGNSGNYNNPGDDGNSDDDEDDANMRCCDEGIFRNGDYGDGNNGDDDEECDTPNTALDNNTLGQDNSDGIWWHDEGGDDDDDEVEILDRRPALTLRTAVSYSSNVPALLRKTPPTASPKRPSTAAGRVKQLMSEGIQSSASSYTSHGNYSSNNSSSSGGSSGTVRSGENSRSQDQAKNKSEVEGGEVPMENERVDSENEEGDKEDSASDSDDFSDFESIIWKG